jgi:hypothetical protein
VPLPPPAVDTSALTFTNPSPGMVVLTGEPRMTHANARFYIIDRQNGDGTIVTAAADGSFATPPMAAMLGDVAEIYYQKTDGTPSEHTCVTVLFSAALVGASCP